jgi:hypothetical protein
MPKRRRNGISPEKRASAITVAISHLTIARLSHPVERNAAPLKRPLDER